jgi:trimeric autotransporter adhesin
MASSYVNDLRLNEMATGDASGTWGDTTNTNLELIAEAFSYGTEAITTNADTHTTTIADGATDPGRSMYLKYTGTLDSACTITIGPNTVSKVWIIENGTSGSQDIILSQGSGANITIPAGDTKVVYSDGAGAGAAFFDAFASINVGALTGTSLDISGDIDVDGTTNLDIVDIDGAVDMASTLAVAGVLTGASLDISGDIDVDGTTNLDVVDVDGAVNFAADVTFADGADIITASAGTSNFRAGVNAGNSIESGGNYNVVVGDEAGTAITTGDQNTFVGAFSGEATATTADNTGLGLSALRANTGASNTALGSQALRNNTTADNNTAVGFSALYLNTTGAGNVAVGALALDANTTGANLVAIGSAALGANTTADNNTAIGAAALAANTEGAENVAIGVTTLDANTTGIHNVAVGNYALTANTTGQLNTAIGHESMFTSTTGSSCVGVGRRTLYSNTTASNNTALGYLSLYLNTEGSENTGVGGSSMQNTTTGGGNAAVGYGALAANTTGATGVAVGAYSLHANTTADSNVAVGYFASRYNTTGANNTAVGYYALAANTTASGNTAVGFQSLLSNTEGASNHGFGRNAGQNITTGNHNIAIGYDSLVDTVALTTGSQNIAIGNFTRTNAADSTYATVIGYNVSGTSGYFTIGRDAQDIRAAHGVATWATVSDERYKKDITDSTAGLSFINALQPRTFKYKTLGELPETFNAYEADSTEVFKNSNTNHGFIAQEVKAAIDADDSIKDGFKLWDDREDGSQEVAEAALIPVLVKAIQELSAQNAELTTRITALEG